MPTDSKNRIIEKEQINKLRKRFGKPPIDEEKSYEERLEEYKSRPPIKRE